MPLKQSRNRQQILIINSKENTQLYQELLPYLCTVGCSCHHFLFSIVDLLTNAFSFTKRLCNFLLLFQCLNNVIVIRRTKHSLPVLHISFICFATFLFFLNSLCLLLFLFFCFFLLGIKQNSQCWTQINSWQTCCKNFLQWNTAR